LEGSLRKRFDRVNPKTHRHGGEIFELVGTDFGIFEVE
jgi:hypothetical protein